MDRHVIGVHGIMSIYPSLPANATKDYFEMVEPIEAWELECKCKFIDGELEECESCKQYIESKQVQSVIDVLQTLIGKE